MSILSFEHLQDSFVDVDGLGLLVTPDPVLGRFLKSDEVVYRGSGVIRVTSAR